MVMSIRPGSIAAAMGTILVFLSSSVSVFAAEAPRLNVLFMISDDLTCQLGCYGDPQVQSPNLDRLAASGVRFDKAYTQFPLCGPSRNALMTGRRPNSTHVLANSTLFRQALPDAVTMSQLFKNHDYFAARAGKIYHYGVPGDIGADGVDDPPSWNKVVNPKGRDKTDEDLVINLTPSRGLGSSLSYLKADGDDLEQTDAMVATSVIRMLEENKDRPFFIACGFFRPHVPDVAPAKWFDLYPYEQVKLPVEPPEHLAKIPQAAFFTTPPNWGVPEDQVRKFKQAYLASVSFMDAQAGRVLDALDRLQLRDRTIVVFTSDHGWMLGQHGGQWMKQQLFERATRVPLLIRAPGFDTAGRACPRPVEMIDIYPTLADLAGLQAPRELEGVSLKPLLVDPDAPHDRPAYSQITRGEGRSVRTERHRYTEWSFGKEGVELYDYQADPHEWNNLAGDPAHAALQAEMKRLLNQRLATLATDAGGKGEKKKDKKKAGK
jgi:uncharacterized sulfatase